MCANCAEGAPSLRFLQGRVTMLPTQLSAQWHMRSGSRPLPSAQRTGHPLCLRRQRGQKPGPPACSLTHSSPLRFESPLSQVQGDLRLLLTFTYHGCPHVSRPKFKYSASAVFANAGEVLLDVIASGQAGAVFSVCPVPHPRAHHLKWSPVGVPLPG